MTEKTKNKRKVRKERKIPYDDLWRIPDALWAKIEPLLPPGKPHPLGCHNPAVDPRKAMNGIFFVLRTGCQWNALNATGICSSSSAHRWFQEWTQAGVFLKLWKMGLLEYDRRKKLGWRWQALDAAITKAPLGGGKKRPEPHRPSQTRGQTQRADRGARLAHRFGDRRRQSARQPTGAVDAGKRADPPSQAHPEEAATSGRGQGLFRRPGVGDLPGVRLYGSRPAPGGPGAGTQTPDASQGPPLGGREDPQLDEPLPPDSHPLGEETRELFRVASSGLCSDHLSSGWPTGIGSKSLLLFRLPTAEAGV
jgi:transposase